MLFAWNMAQYLVNVVQLSTLHDFLQKNDENLLKNCQSK